MTGRWRLRACPLWARSVSHAVGTLARMQIDDDLDRLVDEGAPVRKAHAGAEAYVGRGVQRREEREAALDVLLAPGATRPVGAGTRARVEEPDAFRLCFERDLDRVKHSRPW